MISVALKRIGASQTTLMTDRAAELRAAGRDIISLSVGELDFATPPHIIDAAKTALDAGETRYSPVAGTAALREAAAAHISESLGHQVGADNIIVGAGGKACIFHALAATISPGEEVIIPSPWWVSYPEIVRYCGGQAVPLITHAENNYHFSAGDLEALITPATSWLLLNSPGNPTGAVYPRAMLEAIGEVLERHPQIMVLSDDIYAELNYTGAPHQNLAALRPDLASRIVTIYGVSKAYAMTGFRIGFAAGPKPLIAAMTTLQSHSSGCPSSLSQAAALAALTGPQEFLGGWRSELQARRDALTRKINTIPGLSCPVPEGAFYCFVDASAHMMEHGGRWENDAALSLHLLEHGVAVVPASAFGGANGFRVSFAAHQDNLDAALERIAEALAD